jgi:hypothetical protein
MFVPTLTLFVHFAYFTMFLDKTHYKILHRPKKKHRNTFYTQVNISYTKK